MKFKNYIETESGIKDTSASPGAAGQLLSSTVAGTSWIDQNTISSGTSETIDIQVKNISSADGGINLVKGDPVYIYGSVGASARLYVDLADADSTATNNLGDSKMPCVALLDQDLSPNGEGTATVVGKLRNLITNPIDGSVPNENDTVYVKSGGGLTLTKPAGSTNLIQNVGQVGRVSTSADGNIVVAALLRTNDVPNLPEGRLFVGTSANTSLTSDVVYVDDANDRVGIGTSSPDVKLHVDSDGDSTVALFDNTSGTSSRVGFRDQYGESSIATVASNLIFTTGASLNEGMRVNNNQDVGIGTQSPTEKLTVGDNTSNAAVKIISYNNAVGTEAILKLCTTTSTNSQEKAAIIVKGLGGSFGKNDMHFALDSAADGGNVQFSDTKMTILNGGNVGIGTTSPSSQLSSSRVLDISSTGNSEVILDHTDAGATSDLGLYSWNRNNDHLAHVKASCDGATDSAFISFHAQATGGSFSGPGSNEKMRIKSNGNVGINTTDPKTKLHVASANGSDTPTAGTATGGLFVSNTNKTYGINMGVAGAGWSFIQGQRADGNTTLYNLNLQPLGGNVGIGTTTPQAKLHVSNGTLRTWSPSSGTSAIFESTASSRNFVTITAANEAELWFGNASTQTLGRIRYEMAGNNMEFWTNATQKMVINGSGDVGIGITGPAEKLHVNGNVRATQFQLSSDTQRIRLFFGTIYMESTNGVRVQNSSGTLKPVTASAFNTSSDYRLKSNIVPLEGAISRLNQLEVHRFNWNDRLDQPKVDGFIAHEVAPIIPEAILGEKDAVHEDGTPDYQGIDQAKLVPLLTAALQEAISKIEQLETRIQKLENK